MSEHNTIERKKTNLYIVLSGVFFINALLAETIGVKFFSIPKLFGYDNVNVPFFNDFSMSVGVLIWPIVFILSDVVNEYFGRSGVKKLSILGAILIVYSSVFIFSSTQLPPADWWVKNNMVAYGIDINHAYNTIFNQQLGIIIGSVVSFLVGQLIDAYIFHRIKLFTGHKRFLWLRSTGSTAISQLVDSYLILFIAFYLLGTWSIETVLAVGTLQYVYKMILAGVLTPAIYVVHWLIDGYLGKDAKEVLETADTNIKS